MWVASPLARETIAASLVTKVQTNDPVTPALNVLIAVD